MKVQTKSPYVVVRRSFCFFFFFFSSRFAAGSNESFCCATLPSESSCAENNGYCCSEEIAGVTDSLALTGQECQAIGLPYQHCCLRGEAQFQWPSRPGMTTVISNSLVPQVPTPQTTTLASPAFFCEMGECGDLDAVERECTSPNTVARCDRTCFAVYFVVALN